MVFYENEPIFNIKVDASKDKYPFILNGVFEVKGEERSQTNQCYRVAEQLRKSIEKLIDKHDETLEVFLQVK